MKLETKAAMRLGAWLAGLLILAVPVVAHAQSWSGIIARSRATDWSGAGAAIQTRNTVCQTIAPYSGSAATINNAIAACPAGQVVQLGAGTFNLSTGVELGKSNVTLRGAGASSTLLAISGLTGRSCHIGAGRVLNMCSDGGGNIGVDSAEHTANWTAGYAQGTTVVTLSSVTGLQVGSTLWLDQLDDPADGWPLLGDLYICDVGSPNCGNNGTGESYARGSRGLTEGQIVTAINGNQVTISPGVRMPSIRASQSPGAWWGNAATIMQNTGLEHLTVDFTNAGGAAGAFIINCTHCWVKGVRFIKNNEVGSNVHHLFTVNAMNVSIVDNYFYGPNTTQLVSIYQNAIHVTSNSLIQNNIYHTASSSIVLNSTHWGNVVSYNYFDNDVQPGIILHGVGGMNLHEGNNANNFSGDTIHGPHFFDTLFRNHHDGRAHNPSETETEAAVTLYSNNRFFNIIGNVFGAPNWSRYQSNLGQDQAAIYVLGWRGTGSGTPVPDDVNVLRTIMRWGNWDNVNNGARFVASEVPSLIGNFANPVPGSQALPASFYLSARPGWFQTPWATPPWPPIGPDVTGGNVANSATGGHAYKIPARLCFENTGVDPAYPSSSPRIRQFSAGTCYGQATQQAIPAAPGAPSLQ
ncbi:MAG: hypothetical protein DMD96_11560 [Candidatus Rokuibacteriota bacterium]|nr:MAG: hypothetical protein DMD96_11560 [Candidatus Rokubacteria bacterium]